MRIIAKRVLLQKAAAYPDCAAPLMSWYRTAIAATWRNLAEVKAVYPHADLVGDKTVFNLKGNHYRLIVYINYQARIIYIKDLLTHADYDKGAWK